MQLTCPKCGYSLKGQQPEGSVLRCPECGRLTSLRFILDDQRRKQRGRRDMLLAVGFGTAVIALAMVLSYRARLEPTSFRSFDRMGLIGAIVFMVALIMSLRWIGATWRHRLLFALGLAGLVALALVVRGPLSYILGAAVVAWFIGYHVHALRQGYY